MLVSREPIRVDVPHEEGAWFELRKLSHTQLRAARKAAERANRETMKELGAKILKAFQSPGGAKEAGKLLKDQEDKKWDVSNFDGDTLMELSIAAWSYDDKVAPDTIAQLDSTTSEWAADEIMEISRPASAKQEKKDLLPSTEH